MDAPLTLEVTLGRPAVRAGEEPQEPVHARVRLRAQPERAVRPPLDLCFVLDASASMHRFYLDPAQRAFWQGRAQARGEVTRGQVDGKAGMVWTGETLRELQQHVSTPMLSSLRGVWRTLDALQPHDRVAVLAFADQTAAIYQDDGVADNAQRLQEARTALGRLGSGVDESGLGRGTRLAGALQSALERCSQQSEALHRVVLVSDGIIEDLEACRPLLDAAAERGLVISAIGVGDEFDEEFLMRAADLTRGSYYYAATAPEVEQAVLKEMALVGNIVARQAVLVVQAESGTLVRDAHPVAPELSLFQTVWVHNGAWRFRIGDVSAAQETEFLLELAPGAFSAGQVQLGTVRVEGLEPLAPQPFAAEAPVSLFYSDEAVLLQARDDEVLDQVRRLEVYRLERRAAEAASEGDQEESTRNLRAATRMLREMGRDSLADEMDAAASAAESGTRDLTRTKRVKAGTRRLGAG